MVHKVVVFFSLMLCHATRGSEQAVPLLLDTNHNAVVINIQSNIDIDPYPKNLLKILSREVPSFPLVINDLILQYAWRKRDYEGDAQKKNFNLHYENLENRKRFWL